jgi:membrane-associated protease RseP (regulator of RpoE activity)
MKKARIHFFVNEYEDLGHEVQPVIKDDMEYYFKQVWPRTKRNLFPNLLDWTCVNTDRGQCHWVQVTEIMDLGKASADIPNYKIVMPTPRVRLGVALVRDVAPPQVETVQEGSTAEKMGIKAGDEIVKLDEQEIKSFDDLAKVLGSKAPEDKVKVGIKRGDEELTLEGQFDKAQAPAPEPLSARVRGFYSEKYPGCVTLTVRNTGKVRVHVHPTMVEDGFLKVEFFSGLEGLKSKVFAVKPDNDYILRRFEQAGDRKLPFICEVEVDVAALLGVRAAPQEG